MRFRFAAVICLCLSQTITCDLRVARQSANAGGSRCTTPDGKIGVCVNVRSCPSLNEMLVVGGQNSQNANFLRDSQCDSESAGSMTLVCCPANLATSDTTRWNGLDSTRWNAADTTRSNTAGTTRWNWQDTTRPNAAGTTRWNEPEPTRSNSAGTTRWNEPGTTRPNSANTARPTARPVNLNYEECGRSEKKESRIVGGANATLGDWPWMVGLGYRSTTKTSADLEFKCGATLISKNWVITAAHCVQNVGNFKLTTARLGDLDLNQAVNDGATPIDEEIAQIIPHPQYTASPISNDIALLRLKNTVKFSKFIRPICLLTGSEYRSDAYYNRKMPYIIGWGALEWRGFMSSRLQETKIRIVNHTDCSKIYTTQPAAIIDERVLCAGEKDKDTCQGDSGGPLIFPVQSESTSFVYNLGGIVSFGVKCADLTYPGVYTRVAAFADWIRQTTGMELRK